MYHDNINYDSTVATKGWHWTNILLRASATYWSTHWHISFTWYKTGKLLKRGSISVSFQSLIPTSYHCNVYNLSATVYRDCNNRLNWRSWSFSFRDVRNFIVQTVLHQWLDSHHTDTVNKNLFHDESCWYTPDGHEVLWASTTAPQALLKLLLGVHWTGQINLKEWKSWMNQWMTERVSHYVYLNFWPVRPLLVEPQIITQDLTLLIKSLKFWKSLEFKLQSLEQNHFKGEIYSNRDTTLLILRAVWHNFVGQQSCSTTKDCSFDQSRLFPWKCTICSCWI